MPLSAALNGPKIELNGTSLFITLDLIHIGPIFHWTKKSIGPKFYWTSLPLYKIKLDQSSIGPILLDQKYWINNLWTKSGVIVIISVGVRGLPIKSA